MTGDQFSFRTDPGVTARVRELVREGGFRNRNHSVNRAVLPKCEIERIPIDGGPVGGAPFARFPGSPREVQGR